MADYAHRDTLAILLSGNPPDYPDPPWLRFANRAEALAAADIPQHYRKIESDRVVEMSQAEKDVVDQAARDALVIENREQAESGPDDEDEHRGWSSRAIIELLNKRDNYLANRIVELQEDMQAIKASAGPADSIRDAISVDYSPTGTRTRSAAIADYKDIIASGDADTTLAGQGGKPRQRRG